MRVALLGPLRVAGEDGAPIDIGGARLRMLTARLALAAGRPVPVEALVDGLWGEEPPSDAAGALQSLVSRLRRVLPGALESGPAGYRLVVDPAGVDAGEFERLAAEGRRALAADRDAEAAAGLAEALGLWRGDALVDVLDAPFAPAAAARLAGLRAEAVADRFEADLRLGRHDEVLADLTAAGADDPLRERLAGLRIRALCAAGRQAEALAVYAETRRLLAEELGADPSPELGRLHLAALRGELAPPSAAVDRLPTRLTSFVGRDEELKLLAESVAGARLVTLVGPGGAGKTRLATEAAARHPAHARGRVFFAPLAGVRDPDDLGGALLAALEVRELRGGETEVRLGPVDLLDQAAEAVAGGETLLVLDNCEHLIDEAAALADALLHRAPELRILATSREPLAITGETLCPVGPLPVPADHAEVAEAAGLDATRLFLDRAAAVRPDFVLDDSTVADVAQICRRLDGLPLALELAAARLRSMSVAQIAGRLDDRFRLLTTGSRTALPRQRTLRAVVEWSWDLLTEPETVLARRFAVFAGSATAEVVEAVCADPALPAADVPYVLGSLVEKSIVDTVPGAGGGTRYRMLETLRVFALDRLADSGEQDPVRRAQIAHYAKLVAVQDPLLRTRAQLGAMAFYQAESGNLVDALRAGLAMAEVDSSVSLLNGMFWYLVLVGQGQRMSGLLTDVLAFEDQLPPATRAVYRTVHQLIGRGPDRPEHEVVRGLVDDCLESGAMEQFTALSVCLPILAFQAGDRPLAIELADRSVAGSDPWGRAGGHWMRSFLLADEGDIDGTSRELDLAHREFSTIGDRWGIAMTLGFNAAGHSHAGDNDRAIELYQEGLTLSLELGSPEEIIQSWWRLSVERARSGDLAGARRDLAAAERYGTQQPDPQHRAVLAFGQLDLALRTGDLPTARAALAKVRTWSTDAGFPDEMSEEWVAVGEARLALAEGRPDAAAGLAVGAALATSRRADMADLAGVVELLARIRHAQHRPRESVALLGTAELLRGRLDLGDKDIRDLVATLRADLTDPVYTDLFRSTRDRPKAAAIAALHTELTG